MVPRWQYPLFVVRHGGGYASVQVVETAVPDRFAMAVFTSKGAAEEFTDRLGIEGKIETLRDERSFARLVAGLREPFTDVVFDAAPEEDSVNARWQISVSELLSDHLSLARSPWNYPVYVLQQEGGLAAIQGDHASAIALFTNLDRLAEYQQAAELAGVSRAIARPEPLAELLRSLPEAFTAVAVNPTFADGVHVANHCVGIRTVLEKYLSNSPNADGRRSG